MTTKYMLINMESSDITKVRIYDFEIDARCTMWQSVKDVTGYDDEELYEDLDNVYGDRNSNVYTYIDDMTCIEYGWRLLKLEAQGDYIGGSLRF